MENEKKEQKTKKKNIYHYFFYFSFLTGVICVGVKPQTHD